MSCELFPIVRRFPPKVKLASDSKALVPFPVSIVVSATVVNPVPPLATVTVSDKVDPAAVTVIAADPSKSTPLIALGVARVVASAAKVAVSALPVVSAFICANLSLIPADVMI